MGSGSWLPLGGKNPAELGLDGIRERRIRRMPRRAGQPCLAEAGIGRPFDGPRQHFNKGVPLGPEPEYLAEVAGMLSSLPFEAVSEVVPFLDSVTGAPLLGNVHILDVVRVCPHHSASIKRKNPATAARRWRGRMAPIGPGSTSASYSCAGWRTRSQVPGKELARSAEVPRVGC